MQYKGHELKEITKLQIFDPPKKMLAWDVDWSIEEMDVIAILPILSNKYGDIVVARGVSGNLIVLKHCAEIPEELKPRRATNRELSRWLAQGNGEAKDIIGCICTYCIYRAGDKENEPVLEGIKVRKWDDTEWHEPTVDYMGQEA